MMIASEITFEAAHMLPHYEGKCRNLHGHSYKWTAKVTGPVGDTSMVLDFKRLRKIMKNIAPDHFYIGSDDAADWLMPLVERHELNSLNLGNNQPTAEAILTRLMEQLSNALPAGVTIASGMLEETEGNIAIWTRKDS